MKTSLSDWGKPSVIIATLLDQISPQYYRVVYGVRLNIWTV